MGKKIQDGNKGVTWARKVHQLNKSLPSDTWDLRARTMTNDEWDEVCVALAKVEGVLREKAPVAFEKARVLIEKYASGEEHNVGAALLVARGTVVLGELLRCQGQVGDFQFGRPNL